MGVEVTFIEDPDAEKVRKALRPNTKAVYAETIGNPKGDVPDIAGTEKPMDLMFINALTRSESFPPDDSWLSGFSVSYYYFGYLLVAMVGKLAAVQTSIAFNLGLAMTAALAVTAAFGLVYDLVAARQGGEEGAERASGLSARPLLFGLAAGLILAVDEQASSSSPELVQDMAQVVLPPIESDDGAKPCSNALPEDGDRLGGRPDPGPHLQHGGGEGGLGCTVLGSEIEMRQHVIPTWAHLDALGHEVATLQRRDGFEVRLA